MASGGKLKTNKKCCSQSEDSLERNLMSQPSYDLIQKYARYFVLTIRVGKKTQVVPADKVASPVESVRTVNTHKFICKQRTTSSNIS